MKRVTASSPLVCSLLCFFPVSSFGRNFRASPSCSHGQPDVLRQVDLVFLRSLCCILCVVWAVLEPVVPLMLDRNSSLRVNSVATGEPLSLRRDGSVLFVEVLLQRSSGGVCQALLLIPAQSHFGEFLTELSLAILLLHLVYIR
ncbi:BnaC02g44610D [Brassica napus]|uniref:(rape) hypothetical protein n=1 Tax=Brassica napus TaxID=3708 RepID=A0A078IMC4_BRANA|nr:unnamed protein product [Brassica napus]CDY52240.1 BnaC02g44610D [Brassica napus]